MSKIRSKKNRRKKFIVYPPDYQPGNTYKVVYSWRRAFKLAYKLGSGSEIYVSLFERRKDGSMSFWNIIEIYEYKNDTDIR